MHFVRSRHLLRTRLNHVLDVTDVYLAANRSCRLRHPARSLHFGIRGYKSVQRQLGGAFERSSHQQAERNLEERQISEAHPRPWYGERRRPCHPGGREVKEEDSRAPDCHPTIGGVCYLQGQQGRYCEENLDL